MWEFLSKADLATLLGFLITIITVIASTFFTIRSHSKSTKSQLDMSREVINSDKSRSRAEFISNSRQEWINSLREEVSVYISEIYSIFDLFLQKSGRAEVLASLKNPEYAMTELGEWSVRYGSAFTKVQKSRAKINLMLNPNEPLSVDLIKAIDDALKKVKDNTDPVNANVEIINKLKPILKAEWERVKKLDGV